MSSVGRDDSFHMQAAFARTAGKGSRVHTSTISTIRHKHLFPLQTVTDFTSHFHREFAAQGCLATYIAEPTPPGDLPLSPHCVKSPWSLEDQREAFLLYICCWGWSCLQICPVGSALEWESALNTSLFPLILRATPASQWIAAHGNSSGRWDTENKIEVNGFYIAF